MVWRSCVHGLAGNGRLIPLCVHRSRFDSSKFVVLCGRPPGLLGWSMPSPQLLSFGIATRYSDGQKFVILGIAAGRHGLRHSHQLPVQIVTPDDSRQLGQRFFRHQNFSMLRCQVQRLRRDGLWLEDGTDQRVGVEHDPASDPMHDGDDVSVGHSCDGARGRVWFSVRHPSVARTHRKSLGGLAGGSRSCSAAGNSPCR